MLSGPLVSCSTVSTALVTGAGGVSGVCTGDDGLLLSEGDRK